MIGRLIHEIFDTAKDVIRLGSFCIAVAVSAYLLSMCIASGWSEGLARHQEITDIQVLDRCIELTKPKPERKQPWPPQSKRVASSRSGLNPPTTNCHPDITIRRHEMDGTQEPPTASQPSAQAGGVSLEGCAREPWSLPPDVTPSEAQLRIAKAVLDKAGVKYV